MRREKVDPAFLSPSGILMKQYVPKGVMKLVLALSSSCTIDYLVDPWQREIILGAGLVEAGEIDTHPPLAALLLHHDYVGQPRRVGDWFDEIGLK